ncbi:MAG: DUF5667 domain-containing protein [Dehalococcoidia bacterium]|nr:DUF5667 domain-containing protein [Dehalococcoidia bacterium]
MVSPRQSFFAAFFTLTIISWGVMPQVVSASRSDYFDFGPYYQPQVLGLSLSSLEHLPPLNIPTDIMPPVATGVLPDSPLYNFERLIENAQLTFTFDPVAKEQVRLGFAQERLAEAKTLIDAGKTESGATALADYRETITDVAQSLPGLAGKGSAAQELINKIEETVAAQTVIARSLSLTSPPRQAESWTKVANVGGDVLDKVAEARGEPAIPEELSTGIQQLKSQGLISEEESNKLYSFKGRSEVREELDKLSSSGTFPLSELTKMDTAVGRYYPEVHGQYRDNLQVVELRAYQGLPQPSAETVKELEKWRKNSDVAPSNNIKPYLWYTRVQDLAKEVDLTNFSQAQQADLAKFYPAVVSDNPTYDPVISPTPEPNQTSAQPSISDQTATATAVPSPTVMPGADLEKARDYLGETGGALPGEPAYFLKQFGEQVRYTFALNPADKSRLKMQYAEARLAEARQLAEDPKKASLYESTIRSYRQAMDDASTQLQQAGESEGVKDVARDLENQAARHEVVFERGLLPAPVKSPEVIKDAIAATEDAMDRSADVLGRPALPPVLGSRLEDLKAQGLILSEEVEDLTRSGSREEVREKVRKLLEIGSFPPADAKKLDEAQATAASSDYNQLVEVRKIEELQGLRSVQAEIAQTPALRNAAVGFNQRGAVLVDTIDPTLFKEEDLGGRVDLIQTYQALVATASARPLNGGQFGSEVRIGTTAPVIGAPGRADAVLSACPEGAVFKQSEGCVWADSGKKLNDYDQYKCEGPRQYYSFAAKKCVSYDPLKGFRDDAQPICPVGYNWSWQNQSCEARTGGGIPFPSPSPEPEPVDDKELAIRSKACPEGSSYKAPNGCVWDKDGKSVYDSNQYRCGRGQYYSFDSQKCVSSPKVGEPYPKDAAPGCKESEEYWSWQEGKCLAFGTVTPYEVKDVEVPQPFFTTPGSPFYFLKQAGENVRQTLAFTPQARGEVRLAQAKERLAEAVDALKRNDEKGAKLAIDSYITAMQGVVSDVSREGLSEMAKNEMGQLLGKEAVGQDLILQKVGVLAGSDSGLNLSAANSAIILGVDKAADLKGEDPIPADLKAKIESFSTGMISEEDKKKILESGTRVEARLAVGSLSAKGLITVAETSYLNDEFKKVDPGEQAKLDELKKLAEITSLTKQKAEVEEKVEKNEGIVKKLDEFQRTFEVGKEIPADVRPYVRLTRIEEVAQTVRPDAVRLEDFQNRKDLVLAVATLQQEFKPTRQDVGRVEEFRRRNPNVALSFEFARIEALAYSLGVREQAGACFLPTPPFPANTPCPPPGASIPITSYSNFVSLYSPVDETGSFYGTTTTPSTDKDGKPLVYGQGPKPSTPGVCQAGYHWMYDSGGWCMSDGGSYGNTSGGGTYTPSGYGSGYTPYSPYYTAPGASPTTSGYPTGGNYPTSSYSYSAPSYYGSAPTYYTTTPPSGTVPGSGPRPVSPGQCPSGFHWMSDSGGWCMADGGTYVPAGGYSGGGSSYYSPNLTQSSCGPGYYWDGRGCIPTYSGSSTPGSSSGGTSSSGSYYSGWTGSSCSPPSSGCGSNNYWDYGTCSCRPSGSSYSGSYSSPGSYSGSSSGPSAGCSNYPAGGCGSSSWFDWGSCSCRASSSSSGTSTYTSGSSGGSSGSCPSGSHWMSDNGGYCMSDGGSSTTSSGGSTTTSTTTSSGGGSSSGSCPSGYHWMSDNGGWCMSDGGSTSTSTSSDSTTSQSTTTSTAPSSSEPTPAPSTSTSTESSPPPSTTTTTTTTTTTESSPSP